MTKTKEQLNEMYDWGMQILMFINTDMMSGDSDHACKNYSEAAKVYADEKSQDKEGFIDFIQGITDLQTLAKNDSSSWKIISQVANTGLTGPEDAKKWLLEEVIPPLVAEAEKRGWIK